MRLAGRHVIMLRRHLDSPLYSDRWPIIFIRDKREDVEALCGRTYTRVGRTIPRSRYSAKRLGPCSLVYVRDGEVHAGGVYKLEQR